MIVQQQHSHFIFHKRAPYVNSGLIISRVCFFFFLIVIKKGSGFSCLLFLRGLFSRQDLAEKDTNWVITLDTTLIQFLSSQGTGMHLNTTENECVFR